MRSKLQKNAIITGYINAFCLVCECHLDTESVALCHISCDEHGKNLGLFPYLEKYKNESIRKLKNGYFCEYCNKLIDMMSNIESHVDETDHNNNKVYKSLQRVKGFIIAFNKIVIDENDWHSLTDKTCAICNTKFENEEIHKSDATHLIKLVQSTVKLHGNGLYRIMDDSTFQCLSCNILLANQKLNEHFNSENHQKNTAECQRTFENKYGAIDKVDPEFKIKEMGEECILETDAEPDTDDSNDEFLENYLIDFPTTFDSNMLMCLSSDNGTIENVYKPFEDDQAMNTTEASNTNNNSDGISNKNDCSDEYEGKKNDEEKPILMCEKQDFEISEVENVYETAQPIYPQRETYYDNPHRFALRNWMVMTELRADHVYCKLCTDKVPLLLNELKKHVFTRKHMTLDVLAALHAAPALNTSMTYPLREFVPFRMPMIDFVFNKTHTQNHFDYLINMTYCITTESYNLVYQISDTHLLCHVCNYKKPFHYSETHRALAAQHGMLMNMSLVLTELKDEFIREISTNRFHCGFCNLVVTSLRDLKDHMRGELHKKFKLIAYRRLHENNPMPGQLAAIDAIMEGRDFTPDWAGPHPGLY